MERLEFGNPDHIKILKKAQADEEALKGLRDETPVGTKTEEVCADCGYSISDCRTLEDDTKKYLICGNCDALISRTNK